MKRKASVAILILGLLALGAWAGWRAWVASAGVTDLSVESGWSSPDGAHVLAVGPARLRGSDALVVLAGRGVVERAGRMASRPSFARDAHRAAWLRAEGGDGWTIAVCDLTSGRVHTAGVFAAQPAGVAITPDGTSVATYAAGRVELVDAASGATRWSLPLRWPGSTDPLFFFASNDRLLFYPPQRGEARPGRTPVVHPVLELDTRTRTVRPVASFTSDAAGLFVRPSADGQAFLTLERNRSLVKLTNRTLETDGLKLRSAALLADGDAAVVLRGTSGSVVRGGGCSAEVPEAPAEVWIREVAPRRVLLAVAPREKAAWQLYEIDLNRCSVAPLVAGLTPLDRDELWFAAALPRGPRFWNGALWFVNARQQLERVRR